MKDELRLWYVEKAEKFAMWIAWRLSRRVVYWCGMRIIAHCTRGVVGEVNAEQLTAMNALDIWTEEG